MKQLSDMENRVAEQYCHGLTDKEIADELDKPIWTVRTHKKHIYKIYLEKVLAFMAEDGIIVEFLFYTQQKAVHLLH